MTKAEVRILRGDNVRIQGRHTLGLGPDLPGSANHRASPPKQPRHVAIVQSNPEFTLIEVTCTCGEKMQVKCTHAPAKPLDQTPQQTKEQQTMPNHEPQATAQQQEVEKNKPK